MKAKDYPRLALTVFIMLLLGYASWEHYSPGIEETIKAIALIAVGYWLGSSKGSADKTDMLEPPRKVEIDQPSDHPVPVDPK